MRRAPLSIKQILAWADAHQSRTGKWPDRNTGQVWEPADEKWRNIDNALRMGLRGLHRGQSLAKLLAKYRGKRNRKDLPKYTSKQILAWADAFQAREGRWPRSRDGAIANTHGETWWAVDMALRHGQRGMKGGSSLARLLAANRNVRNSAARPRLAHQQILRWADDHHRRTGLWPTENSGPIPRSDGDTWHSVVMALRKGHRGLKRSSLFRLLARHRGQRRHVRRPRLSIDQVLTWADKHHARTGMWPKTDTGPVKDAPGETWLRINIALSEGKRGLPGGQTLAVVLGKYRSVRTRVFLPPLKEAVILNWARAYRRRHGCWPKRSSGPIPNTGGETWSAIDGALKVRRRGLKRRCSLAQLIDTQH